MLETEDSSEDLRYNLYFQWLQTVNLHNLFNIFIQFPPLDPRRLTTNASCSQQAANSSRPNERRCGELPPAGGEFEGCAPALVAAAVRETHRPGAPGQGGHTTEQQVEQCLRPVG